MSAITATRPEFQAAFESISAAAPSWLPPLRLAAQSMFNELGFPGRRDEDWRFTDITPITSAKWTLAQGGQVAAQPLTDGHALVFVDGVYDANQSRIGTLPAGVRLGSIAQALAVEPSLLQPWLGRVAPLERAPFTALNTALFSDGAYLVLDAGTVLSEPIHVQYLSTGAAGTMTHPRTLISAAAGSQATVVETFASESGEVYWTNAIAEVSVADGAAIDHCRIGEEGAAALHTGALIVTLGAKSHFSTHGITLGGRTVRNDLSARFCGEDAVCVMNGVYVAADGQLIDNHTSIDHAVPHCESHELYKGIIDGTGRGVFNGKIFVRQDAQKTDAKQTNQTLLLSDDAQIHTKPQLEIFADDVRCTHGATVGQLDPEGIFYLRSRGIGDREARALLTFAFANDVVERITVASVRERLSHALLTRLPIEGDSGAK